MITAVQMANMDSKEGIEFVRGEVASMYERRAALLNLEQEEKKAENAGKAWDEFANQKTFGREGVWVVSLDLKTFAPKFYELRDKLGRAPTQEEVEKTLGLKPLQAQVLIKRCANG